MTCFRTHPTAKPLASVSKISACPGTGYANIDAVLTGTLHGPANGAIAHFTYGLAYNFSFC